MIHSGYIMKPQWISNFLWTSYNLVAKVNSRILWRFK